MADTHGRFAWYELLTTDIAAARTFYASVMGWDVQDASTPQMTYTVLTAGGVAVSGLMELPESARKMGATPRWVGYVDVSDANAAADRIRRLGGAVHVPPTDSNIGRIAIVADPQAATLAVVEGLKLGERRSAALDVPGRVGWHELLAADWETALAFYGDLFGWQAVGAGGTATGAYHLFAAGGQTIGGMFTKPPMVPVPFWLHYFNVSDIDAAGARVTAGGGEVLEGPLEFPDGSWIVRCLDPQGAVFALQGSRSRGRDRASGSEIGWSSTWGGMSSKGRLITRRRS